ncbi:MAG: hypothetical protein L0228_03550 [Planctomycetes bacterium]|nr:hypothetical protein [Planctomycetota bacterium]
MSYSFRVRPLWMMAFTLAFAAAYLASVAAAQDFRIDPIDEKARFPGAKATRWVSDRAAYTTDKAEFDNYFQKYFFPAMTRNSPSDLAELGKLRADLFKKFLWGTTNTDLQNNLTDMAFSAMGKIVISQGEPPYHPAVRYNAVLVVGLLDEQYGIDGGNSRPPRPHPKATKALTTIVERATTSNQFPPPVILGAIIGLERHAKYRDALAPGAADKMTAALLTLVKHDKPIQEMDPAAFAWLQLRAASALAQLGSLGPNNAAHDALIKLVNDFKNLDDRCSAAALLGKLKYEGAKIDAPATTAALFKLAHDLGVEELKRATDFEKSGSGGGGFVSPRAERFAAADPNSEYDPYPRRHVLARLVDLRSGLRAVKPAVPEDAQKNVDAILAAIQPVINAASDKEVHSLRITDLIRVMTDAINEVAAPGEVPADDGFSADAPAPAAATPAATPAAAPAAEETPPADAPSAEAPAAEPATPPEAGTN